MCFKNNYLYICHRQVMNESRSKNITKEEKDRLFESEFYIHINAMYNFAYRLVMDEDEANDLVQDAFLKAYRFFDYYEQGTNAKAWLFRIVRNSFINDYRKKSKRPASVDYNDVEEFYNSDEEGTSLTVDLRQETVKQKMGDEVVNAINSLPSEFRMAIILCDIEDFTYEEMSKILDIPLGTVRSRLHRARNVLKDKLNKYAAKLGYNKK